MKDKVAIVTGAGRGIGKAIALAFAREGAAVVVVSRTLSEVEQTADQIRSTGGHVLSLRIDVSKREDVDKMVKSTVQQFAKIDILVNNAGVPGPLGPKQLEIVSPAKLKNTFDVVLGLLWRHLFRSDRMCS